MRGFSRIFRLLDERNPTGCRVQGFCWYSHPVNGLWSCAKFYVFSFWESCRIGELQHDFAYLEGPYKPPLPF